MTNEAELRDVWINSGDLVIGGLFASPALVRLWIAAVAS